MHPYLLFYVWILRTFLESMELFLPTEVIIFIVGLCYVKIKFIKMSSGLVVLKNDHIKIFGRDVEIDVKKIFTNKSKVQCSESWKLQNFMRQNNCLGIRKMSNDFYNSFVVYRYK